MKSVRSTPILMIHCVARGPASGASLPRGVIRIGSDGLLALVSAVRADREALATAIHHDRVVRQAIERFAAVIPLRTGTIFASESAVARILQNNAAQLNEQLWRMTGRVEMGLKAALDAQTHTAADRLALDRWLAQSLAPLASERRERLTSTERGALFEADYLIRLDQVAVFWRAVRLGRCQQLQVPIIATGPWAPYSFCEFSLATTAGAPWEEHDADREAHG